ncbi:MAG: serine/threonine protein kinase [Planctomycetaceae bacterium]|jgi:serine/threonine protein kinase|nr:serine/threonine protein kinase [Planctomycetaceae bacterium]
MSLISTDLAQRIASDYSGKILDGYEVNRLYQVGGTSVILLGVRGNERAAIKLYAKELFDESGIELERINRQVEMKGVSHPNLVRTLGAGVCPTHGYNYLTMDFIEDPTITEIVHELTFDQIRSIAEQTAKAAIFVHERLQLVHRDIKPDNVAVRRSDLHVTLLDLGLVRPVNGPTVTDQGSQHIKGTKRYAPPELIFNTVELDDNGWLAVTYYQLGATLYEMLTKTPPFAGYDGDALLHAIRHTALTIDVPGAPPDLVKLALDCLNKDPRSRLSLVSWGRFLNAPEEETQIAELSDLLTALSSEETSSKVFGEAALEKQRLKRVVADITYGVELSIRSFLTGKERLFPKYEIRRWIEAETEREFVFVVETDFAGLKEPVNVYSVVSTNVEDASSRSCNCRLITSNHPPELPFSVDSQRVIYQGAFVDAEFRRVIGNELARDFKNVLSHQI